jgi:hypothetical protein
MDLSENIISSLRSYSTAVEIPMIAGKEAESTVFVRLDDDEICRKTGVSLNTVKKWLKAADGTEPKCQRKAKPTLLTPYEERLKG